MHEAALFLNALAGVGVGVAAVVLAFGFSAVAVVAFAAFIRFLWYGDGL